MSQKLPLDAYVVDVLMRDLVGHDRTPSAFIVYLWLWRSTHGADRLHVAASLQTIATRTGLAKSSVQNAIRHLARRGLVTRQRSGPTTAPVYEVHRPWEQRDPLPSRGEDTKP